MEFRDLTADEKTTLKLDIMSAYENQIISRIAASWLIQILGLANV